MEDKDTEIIKSLGFESKEDFCANLENVIRDNENMPVNDSDFISITKNSGYNENSELYTIVARIMFSETKPLKDITLKKYTKNADRIKAEKKMLSLSNKYVPFKDYSFSKERQIRLFPKMLEDNLGRFTEKGIILTETSTDSTVHDLAAKLTFWDDLVPSLEPMILLCDYLPHVLANENVSAKEPVSFESFGKEYFEKQEEKFKFLGNTFSDIINEHLPYDKAHQTLMQDKINLRQNNFKYLFDGSRVINGCRSFYLGGFFNHPYFDKIGDIAQKTYGSLMSRRKALKTKELASLPDYNISYDEFEKGFHLGGMYYGQNRIFVLRELGDKNGGFSNDMLDEIQSLNHKILSNIEFLQGQIPAVRELRHLVKTVGSNNS